MSDTLTVPVPVPGSLMTNINLIGADGARSTLEKERGNDKAVVFFMRASTCPICLAHARTILKMQDAGELAGARFILIAPGDAGEAKTVQQRLGSSKASVWASGNDHAAAGLGKFLMMQHSGTFVLDDDGRVLFAKTAAMPVASFSRSGVATALSTR